MKSIKYIYTILAGALLICSLSDCAIEKSKTKPTKTPSSHSKKQTINNKATDKQKAIAWIKQNPEKLYFLRSIVDSIHVSMTACLFYDNNPDYYKQFENLPDYVQKYVQTKYSGYFFFNPKKEARVGCERGLAKDILHHDEETYELLIATLTRDLDPREVEYDYDEYLENQGAILKTLQKH